MSSQDAPTAKAITTYYIYDGDNILWQFNKTGSRTATYIGDGSIDNHIMMIQGSGSGAKAHFYHTDHLNSVVALTDELGEVEEKIVYSSFGKILSRKDKNGNELASTAGVSQPFYFTGREWDGEELVTYHYRAREYSPQTGKFLQLDPAGVNAGLNLFRYVLGNPLRYSDPTGMLNYEGGGSGGISGSAVAIGAVVGGIAGGGSAYLGGGDRDQIITGSVIGAGAGAFSVAAAAGAGVVEAIIANAAIGGTANVVGQSLNGNTEFNYTSFGISVGAGAAGGALGSFTGTKAFFSSPVIGSEIGIGTAIRSEQITGAIIGGATSGAIEGAGTRMCRP